MGPAEDPPSMHRTLPLVVALGLAACNQYGYVPTTNTSATVRGRPAADYQMPPENPTGDVQLATLGIAKLPAVMGATVDALHLSMVVTNNGKLPWFVDRGEQRVQLAGQTTPIYASPDAATPPRVSIEGGDSQTIDLFFRLPATEEKARELPASTRRSGPSRSVRPSTGSRSSLRTTTIGPAEAAPPGRAPGGIRPAPTSAAPRPPWSAAGPRSRACRWARRASAGCRRRSLRGNGSWAARTRG